MVQWSVILSLLINKYPSLSISSTDTVTDHSIWWHYLCISVPHKFVRPNTAFLFIDGGGNSNQ
jgi:hypothetical protein